MEWLDELEARVKDAGRAIADLKRKNRTLTTKVRRLESGDGDGKKGAAGRQREGAEARDRVDRLISRLDELLDG